jgi:hypothetical protein
MNSHNIVTVISVFDVFVGPQNSASHAFIAKTLRTLLRNAAARSLLDGFAADRTAM